MNLHLRLKTAIEDHYGAILETTVRFHQDALIVALKNGVLAEIRYLDPTEYSLAWLWGEAHLRIDTTPLHPHLGTFLNHLHDMDGMVREDPLTVPGADPWENLRTWIDVLLRDPLLQSLPAKA